MLKADYTASNYGSVWLVHPTSDEARRHLLEHLDDDAQWFAGAVAVEPRYLVDLCAQLQDDGFVVEGGR